MVTASHTGDITSSTVYLNIAPATDGSSRRFFQQQSSDYNLSRFAQNSSTLAVFYDVDEDGRLDILLQKGNEELVCVYNNYVKDTFFIKALMVNTENSYGDSSTGASYRLIATDLNDNKFVIIGH